VTDEVLLNVSPVVLHLLEQLLRLEARQGTPDFPPVTRAAVLVAENRERLRHALKETEVDFPHATSRISVEWLQLPVGWSSVRVAARLAEEGIAVLPGPAFFWDNPRVGDSYLRVALMRPSGYFRDAAGTMAALLTRYRDLLAR
jgi:aspartate/methionine/tyrosine aminotransferase